ncbi:abortive infection family protein [Enterococcus faecalis]|nr:abortive infection family protein [Enterococcus faecalis]
MGGDLVFDNNQFKAMLIKMLEKEYNKNPFSVMNDELPDLISVLSVSQIELDETPEWAYRGWNTRATYLRISVPFDKMDFVDNFTERITELARNLYGKQGEQRLVATLLQSLPECFEVIELRQMSVTDNIAKAIEDAEFFMVTGKYDSAFDRAHTAFHGYLKEILKLNGKTVNDNDNLSKLYSQLQPIIEDRIQPQELSNIIKATIRSANGMVNSLNEARNRYSLAHPNKDIIGKNESKLIISIISDITEYLNEYLN